jgi:signal transduction histidine kinase/DNA-binding response OmpR family regulator
MEVKEFKKSQNLYIRELEEKLEQQSKAYSDAYRLQRALFSIAELSSDAANFDDFYASLHSIIARLLYAENLLIALTDITQKKLDVVYEIDQNKTTESLSSINLSDKNLAAYIFHYKKSQLLDDNQIKQLHIDNEINEFDPNIKFWLGVPLISNSSIKGILVVKSYHAENGFKPWHQELLEYASNAIVNALERKQYQNNLEVKVRQRTLKLENEIELRKRREQVEEITQSIATDANSNISLDLFYKQLHQNISKLIYAENFYIALQQESIDKLELVYYVDTVDTMALNALDRGYFLLEKNSLTHYVYSLDKPQLLTAEAIKALDRDNLMKLQGPEPLYWLGIPLIIDNKNIGIIALQSYCFDKPINQQDLIEMESIAKPVATAIERKTAQQQLENKVLQRTKELATSNQNLILKIEEKTREENLKNALYEISNLASGIEDMPDFYRRIHTILGNLFYAENFYIALLDQDKSHLTFEYFSDANDPRELLGTSYPLDNNSFSSLLFRHDKPLLINAEDFAELTHKENVKIIGAESVSWLGAPLKQGGESIGIMVVQSYIESSVYEQWHLDLVEYVSVQVAMTLSRKKAHADLELKVLERTKKLENEIESRKRSQETQSALYFIANLANMDLELDEFYKELHKIIANLVYCENIFVALKDDHDDSFSFVYYQDTQDDYDIDSLSSIPSQKMDKSITAFVMKSGQALLASADKIKEITIANNLDVFGVETVSWLGVPLTINGSVIGIIVLQSYTEDKMLTQADCELMIFVAQHIANALVRNKAKNYLQMQITQQTLKLNQSNEKLRKQIDETERAKKLQMALYQIADLASSNDQVDSLYASLHKIISQLIYAKNFFIALYDDKQEKLEFVYFVDTQDDFNQDSLKNFPTSKLKNTFTGHVLRTGKSFLKSDDNIEEQKRIVSQSVGKAANYWLGVPLKINDDILGVIVVQSYDENIRLDTWHKELLEFVSHHVAITLERKNAQKALEKRVEERTLELAETNRDLVKQVAERKRSEAIQAALYKISNFSARNMPLNILFEKCHQIISRLIYAENFYITLWNEESEQLDWIYFVDSLKREDEKSTIEQALTKNNKTFAHYIIKQAEPILINRKAMHDMEQRGLVQLTYSATEYLLGVPLISGHRTIGAMAVQSYDKGISYTLAEQELLEFVARSIVATIEKREHDLELEARVNRRTEELTISNEKLQVEIGQRKESENLQTALFKISETPQQCATQSELYTRLHEIISRLMHVECFYIALVDVDNQCFNLDYIYDRSDNNIAGIIPMEKSIFGYVYRQGDTIHLNSEQVKQLELAGEIEPLGFYAADLIGEPLIAGDSIYGIMILQSYNADQAYDDKDVDIVNFVSNHIAEALQRKNTEKRLQLAYKELANKTKKAEAASDAKSAFLATVSHEIRTPMNGILGLLSLVSDTSMTQQQRDYIAKITTSANSLLGIINDILDFSKIEQGKLELEHIEFDLIETLDNLLDLFSSRINEKQLQFTINIESNVGLTRLGDQLRLSQVLINLVGNAIKFTEKGYIYLHIRESESGQLLISISDSGIGIEAKKMNKIFATFTQADDTTTRKFGGSGLGLSICKQLIEMMQGELTVTSEINKGSCFEFSVNIPRVKTRQKYPDLSTNKLLLVSDNKRQVEAWKNFCSKNKMSLMVFSAENILAGNGTRLPSDINHIFVDEVGSYNGSLIIVDTIRKQLKSEVPCFLLSKPTPQLSQNIPLNNIQLLPKPVKMSTIFTVIQAGYDGSVKLEHDRQQISKIRPKLVAKKILIAEDNLINQQVAKEFLQNSGAEVKIVNNGQLAVEICLQQYFDLVLMDMQMPIMDGYQASKSIRENFSLSELPIIAMTANVMKGDKEKCLKYGMNDYVAKPVDREKLFKTVEYYTSEQFKQTQLPMNSQKSLEADTVDVELVTSTQFSLEKLAEQFDSIEVAEEIAAIFCKSHCMDAEKIQQLLQQNDFEQARRVIHKLKGSSGDLGLDLIHAHCVKLELELKNTQQSTEQSIKTLDSLLKQALKDLTF